MMRHQTAFWSAVETAQEKILAGDTASALQAIQDAQNATVNADGKSNAHRLKLLDAITLLIDPDQVLIPPEVSVPLRDEHSDQSSLNHDTGPARTDSTPFQRLSASGIGRTGDAKRQLAQLLAQEALLKEQIRLADVEVADLAGCQAEANQRAQSFERDLIAARSQILALQKNAAREVGRRAALTAKLQSAAATMKELRARTEVAEVQAAEARTAAARLQHDLSAIFVSRSWRITRPLRGAGRIFGLRRRNE